MRQTFDAFAAGHPTSQGSGARFRWRGGPPIEDGALGSLARVHDITVLSRPGSRGARTTAFEAALFDSGRPVLMAPPQPPKTLGERILIHWNASPETARTILVAMPILRKAKQVSLIAVEGSVGDAVRVPRRYGSTGIGSGPSPGRSAPHAWRYACPDHV